LSRQSAAAADGSTESRPTVKDVDNQALSPESKKQGTQDMDDRSEKSVTSATSLIVNDLAGNKIGNRPVTCYRFSGFINSVQCAKKSHSERAFTMIEIAIAVGVIGFALVAVIGILPRGMNVQKDNREDTIISQDAPYFLNAIRNGERRTNFGVLSNYVESITINNAYTGAITYNNPFFPNGGTNNLLTNDMNIIGFLSTPEYDPRLMEAGFLVTNQVTAIVHAMTGSAIQQNGANLNTAFRYQLTVENVPWNSIAFDSTNINTPNYLSPVSPYIGGSPDWIIRSNRWRETQFLTNNLHELRLKFAWPVIELPNGTIQKIGGASASPHTYRSLISSPLWYTNMLGSTFWFFQPQSYTNYIYFTNQIYF
jgi:type II secretory pathway pseudopilin PulG